MTSYCCQNVALNELLIGKKGCGGNCGLKKNVVRCSIAYGLYHNQTYLKSDIPTLEENTERVDIDMDKFPLKVSSRHITEKQN